MTMDLLFQEMRDASWDSSESLCSLCSLCSQVLLRKSERIGCLEGQLSQPSSHRGRAVTVKETDVVRENRSERRSVSDRLKIRKKI